MPLHVSSTVCSSSGGQNCIIQQLVSSRLYVAVPCTGRPPTGVMIPDHTSDLLMRPPTGMMIPDHTSDLLMMST